jgi:ferritin
MFNKKIEEAMNKQINAEIYSSYLYYSMAAYFEAMSLKGFSHWMRVQALEELTHAHKFMNFIYDRGGRVMLQPIEGPEVEWKSPLHAFESAYEHEQKVSGLINKLMDLAQSEKDHASTSFLNWFVDEQVEEEASADEIVQQLKLVDQAEGGIFMLDKELNTRTFTMPPELAGQF